MRFSKISVTKKAVDLTRETKDANGAVEEVHLNSPERPLSPFTDALQAFVPYVVELLAGAIDLEPERTTVTTLNLSEDKNGLRGLIVTAIVPVPNAYDKPLVLNTPLVREGGENPSEDAFILSDEVLELISLAEQEATRYVRGERVQGELFVKSAAAEATDEASDNAKTFDERAAAAEVASTRKPGKARGKKKSPAFIPGVGDVHNPTATEVVTDDVLRQSLLAVGRDVPIDAIARWGSIERERAWRWTRGEFAEEPLCVSESAAPLLSDGRTDPVPPRVDTEGAREIMDAAIRS